MPKYEIVFNDGTAVQIDAANPTEAKQAAKRQAQNNTGARERSDQRITVRSIVNLDEQAGPTDPRNAPNYKPRERQGGNY